MAQHAYHLTRTAQPQSKLIMNTRINLAFTLAAALSAFAFSSLSAAPQAALGCWASTISVNSWDSMRETMQTQTIAAGTTRAKVLSLLGRPQQGLAPDAYAYDNCRSDQFVAGDCTTLIVTFEQDRVVDLKFVNDAGMVILAARAKENRTLALAQN